jgi:divinyl protochlorophyllide a 8-vinyl-reductase
MTTPPSEVLTAPPTGMRAIPARSRLSSPLWGPGRVRDDGRGGQAARRESTGLIGPNAILQLIAVLDRYEGRAFRDQLFSDAGVDLPPPDAGMWPETEAAAVHRALRARLPRRAPGLLTLSGRAVADYILQHRIPAPARLLIRLLPGPLGARLLAHAIDRHAWTFAGSGRFSIASHKPLTFEITHNPLIADETAAFPLCHWHRAVFERLFRVLVWRRAEVREVACAAMGAAVCRFVVFPCPPGDDAPQAPRNRLPDS